MENSSSSDGRVSKIGVVLVLVDFYVFRPDLEACSAFGKTPEEALREVEIAKKAWLEAARAAGKPIPEPKYKPVIYQAAE